MVNWSSGERAPAVGPGSRCTRSELGEREGRNQPNRLFDNATRDHEGRISEECERTDRGRRTWALLLDVGWDEMGAARIRKNRKMSTVLMDREHAIDH